MKTLLGHILVPINKLIRYSMILFFTLMVILIFLQIIYRYVLVRPIPWAEEAARYCFIWATFLGASVATKTKGHTSVELIINLVPEKFQRVLNLLGYTISIIFLWFIVKYGYSVSRSILTMKQTSPALQMPMFYAYIGIPLGAAAMALNYLYVFLEEIENYKSNYPKKREISIGGVEEGLQKEDLLREEK
ncbi:MAG TPA: TRAP transporter small permease [Atribacterota bacterium]|nr:TRAP transporter small permease [Atribacterota bacterium]HOR41986.1 TRAP transporter small permease [Atribacterota bacterium]HPK86457.1 TRAP transporter small permease [Atribacterota bacterium]